RPIALLADARCIRCVPALRPSAASAYTRVSLRYRSSSRSVPVSMRCVMPLRQGRLRLYALPSVLRREMLEPSVPTSRERKHPVSELQGREAEVVDRVGKRLFVGGRWRDAAGGATLPVEDPSTGSVIAEVADASSADGMTALDAAVESQSRWAATPA